MWKICTWDDSEYLKTTMPKSMQTFRMEDIKKARDQLIYEVFRFRSKHRNALQKNKALNKSILH